MKSKFIVLLVGLILGISTYAKGIPTSWIMRNGLTDEQIDEIMETNPNASLRLTKSQWMNLKYRVHRYHNVTNYLSSYIKEGTNTFVKTIIDQLDRIDNLNSTNSALRRINNTLAELKDRYKLDAENWMIDATNAWNHYDLSTNRLHIVELDYVNSTNQLADVSSQLADKVSELSAAIEARNTAEAKAQRVAAVKAKIQELRDKAVLSTTKKIYDEILKLFDNEN